jgi:hypothetical protein
MIERTESCPPHADVGEDRVHSWSVFRKEQATIPQNGWCGCVYVSDLTRQVDAARSDVAHGQYQTPCQLAVDAELPFANVGLTQVVVESIQRVGWIQVLDRLQDVRKLGPEDEKPSEKRRDPDTGYNQLPSSE